MNKRRKNAIPELEEEEAFIAARADRIERHEARRAQFAARSDSLKPKRQGPLKRASPYGKHLSIAKAAGGGGEVDGSNVGEHAEDAAAASLV